MIYPGLIFMINMKNYIQLLMFITLCIWKFADPYDAYEGDFWSLKCWGGGIRLIVGFQPLMVISPTARIRWCMQVYACELMWACLVWAERSSPDSFWVPSHWFKSATGEQKGISQTIYTDSEPPCRIPNSLIPSAKLRSANLPVFRSLVWRGRGLNPGLPHPERTL